MKNRFTEEQIMDILKEAEVSMKVVEVWASRGSAKRRTIIGRPDFGGMTVSDVQWLKTLENENAKPKRLLSESMNMTAFSEQREM